jgi:hypothetical protein
VTRVTPQSASEHSASGGFKRDPTGARHGIHLNHASRQIFEGERLLKVTLENIRRTLTILDVP